MKPFIRAAAALLAFTLALGALAQAPEKKKITIAVGGKSLFYYLPLTVAARKGYFKDEGLEVEIPDFAGGAKALQALVGGSADMVSGAYEHTINMAAKKQPIKAVVLQAKFSSIVLLLPKDKAAKYKGPQELKGLKMQVDDLLRRFNEAQQATLLKEREHGATVDELLLQKFATEKDLIEVVAAKEKDINVLRKEVSNRDDDIARARDLP